MTNADKIRAMTDEELADKLTDKCAVCAYHNAKCGTTFCICEEGVLKWLKEDVGDSQPSTKQVRYGEWYLIRSDKEETAEMCSICSGTIVRKSYHKAYEYCPHCGRKMKKENEHR